MIRKFAISHQRIGSMSRLCSRFFTSINDMKAYHNIVEYIYLRPEKTERFLEKCASCLQSSYYFAPSVYCIFIHKLSENNRIQILDYTEQSDLKQHK